MLLIPPHSVVSETKVTKNNVESLGFFGVFGVSCARRARGLCMFWKEETISFAMVSFYQYYICGDVVSSGKDGRRRRINTKHGL